MPTPQQHACDLAGAIIKSLYGDLASELVVVLLDRGRCSLPEIMRATTIPASLVKQLLLMLVQQNCVDTYLQPAEQFVTGLRPATHLYEVSLNRILQSIRGPRFLVFIKQHFGPRGYIAEEAVKLLLEHGRLRLDQIVPTLLSRVRQRWETEQQQQQQQQDEADAAPGSSAAAAAASQQQQGNAPEQEEVQRVFVELVQERFVERAPPCNLPPPQLLPRLAAGKKRATPKPGSLEYAKQQSEALRKLSVRSYEEERFRLPTDVILGCVGQEAAAAQTAADDAAVTAQADAAAAAAAAASKANRKRKKAGGAAAGDGTAAKAEGPGGGAAAVGGVAGSSGAMSAAVAKKRRVILDDEDQEMTDVKQEPGLAIKQDPDAASGGGPPPVLWRVNTEEFNRQFRHQACVALVHSKLGKDAGTVLAAMLAHSGRFEQSLQAECSIAMTRQEVEASYSRGLLAGQLDLLRDWTVGQVLEHLGNDSLMAVTASDSGMGLTYTVNLLTVMERVRLQQVLGTIRDRFEDTGLRIFHLLLHRGQFEQKAIADFSMQPQKETRQVLYQMLSAGYLGLQDIPRTSDRAPSRSFYTWKVQLPAVFTRTAGMLYKAMFNVHVRLAHEIGQHTYLVGMLEQAQEAGEYNFNLTADDRGTLKVLGAKAQQLKASLHSLDQMAALFNEY